MKEGQVRLTHNWKAEALRLRDLLAMERRKAGAAEKRVDAMAWREAEILRMVCQLQAKLDAAPFLVRFGRWISTFWGYGAA